MYLSKFCKASYEYKKCNGKHISVGTFKKKEEPENDDTADIIVKNVNHAQNSALIQTAIASILFDTGSQKSFISTELRAKYLVNRNRNYKKVT